MHATLADVGKRVRIVTTTIIAKPDRSEEPGDPTYALVGVLASIDNADGTHHIDQGNGPTSVEASRISHVQLLC